LVFYQSQESIFFCEHYRYEKFVPCLTVSGKFAHDTESMKNKLIRADGIIPYCESVPEMWNQGRALNPVPGGEYSRMITAVAKDLMRLEGN
jgi:hypothetical protein